MNPLTLVKRIQNINAKEASLGISEDASWHAKYKHSAYVYVGGVPFDLTEGDLLAVFAQYGEVVDVNLVRDKATGKSKGFAFVAYDDQRSTNLAVDNLNGAQILGRIIRVDHVTKYKKMEEEDEETQQKKREERGVCRAFQRGECTRGAGCKFSHDEQRAANTGWGDKDKEPRWGHDNFDDSKKVERRPGNIPSSRASERPVQESDRDSHSRARANKALEREPKQSNKGDDVRLGSQVDGYGSRTRDRDSRERSPKRRSSGVAYQPKPSEDQGKSDERRYRKSDDKDDDATLKSRDEGLDRREERKPRRRGDDDIMPKTRDPLDRREEKRPMTHSDGYEFERKSREEVNNGDKKKNRHNDGEVEPKSGGYEDKRDRERSRRHDDDRYEMMSRDDNGRSDERRSRMHKV